MALTTAQLVAQYTNSNLGKAPDAATSLLLEAYASQTQTGSLTDGQALDKVVDLVDKTTSVAVATYQFFTNKTPSSAGLAFLVNSDDTTGNKTDLNDAYYAKFATENRYINFAVNLGADPASEANASFKAAWGSLTFRQVVETAYEKVIGSAAATAAGVNVTAAIDFLARAENEAYLKAFVKQYAPGVDQDLGVKAALIGTIINAGIAANVGSYATATARFLADLGDDGKTKSTDAVDLLVAYPPTPVAPPVKAFTTAIDNLVGSAGADSFAAVLNAGAATTLNILDSLDGGAGTDTLTIGDSGGGSTISAAGGYTISNVESIIVSSSNTATAGVTVNTTGFAGVTSATVTQALGNAAVQAATVTTAATTATTITSTGGIVANGGSTVTATNSTAGNISIGGTTGAAGDVTATNSFATGSIAIKGAGALKATSAGGVGGTIGFTNGTSVEAVASKAVAEATRTANLDAQTAANTANTAAVGNTDASGVARLAAAQVVTDLGTLATSIAAATSVSADQTTVGSVNRATKIALDLGAITATQKLAIDAAFAAALATSPTAAQTAAQAVLTPIQTAATSASATALAADAVNDAAALTAKTAADAKVTADTTANTAVAGVVVSATTNTALASAKIAGNYGAATSSVTDGSLTNSTLKSVTLDNAGDTTLTGGALTSVTASGQSSNVTVVNTTAAHTQTFTLSGVTAGTYTDANATTVNVVSNGSAANAISLVAGSATTLNLSGAAGITLGTPSLAATATIDASTATGTNSLTIGAVGQTYKGGTGADNITTNGVQTATVDGGAGTDRLTLASNAAGAGTSATKFVNFETLRLDKAVTTVDLAAFTGSPFSALQLNDAGSYTVTGLSSTVANAVTVRGNATIDLGVTGAATVGQIDTVRLSVDDGSAAVGSYTVTTPVLAGVENLILNPVDTTTISSLTGATALTNITILAGRAVTINSGIVATNVNTVVDGSAMTRALTVNYSGATANGVSIIGGAGNDLITGTSIATKGNTLAGGAGNNTITGGVADDIITAGDGNNTVTGSGGNDKVTVGNGNNTITTTTGTDTIVAGNGINVISSGGGADKITVGTGYNLVTGGGGGDTITFGAGSAGGISGIVLNTGDSFTGAVVSGTTVLTGADVVTGLSAGDTIDLTSFTVDLFTEQTLKTSLAAATGGDIALTRGNYDTATGIFTASATGADSILSWDNDGSTPAGTLEHVVLVGFVGAATTTIDGLITLGS